MSNENTPSPAGDKTVANLKAAVVNEIKDDVKEVVLEERQSALDWFKARPSWQKLLIGVGLLALAFVYHKYINPTQPTVINVTPAPVVVQPPAPNPGPVLATATAERDPSGHRLFAKVIRNRLRERLQKDGFALIGGNPKPLTDLEAAVLVNRLDDSELVAAAVQTKAVEDGSLFDKLGGVIDWLLSHKDQILSIIKVLLSLLALFGDQPATP